METRSLNVEERPEIGSGAIRRLRKEGLIPAVIYSDGKEARHVKLNAHEYTLTVRGAKQSQIFKLASKKAELDGKLALIRAVQMEPIKGSVLHVDFIGIEAGHRVTVSIVVELTGESAAIKENRAFLNQTEYEVEIECLPDAIPSVLKLDITELKEGGSLPASAVQLPEGVRLKSTPSLTIVSAISKKAMEAEEAAFEAAAAALQSSGAAAAQPAAAAASADATAVPGAKAAGTSEGDKKKK